MKKKNMMQKNTELSRETSVWVGKCNAFLKSAFLKINLVNAISIKIPMDFFNLKIWPTVCIGKQEILERII